MERVLKKNQRFDWGRIIDINKKVNMDDFVHDPNYCAIYVNKLYTIKKWKDEFKVTEINEETMKSFFSECISYPSGYYWDVFHDHIEAGFFNKRTERIDSYRKIKVYYDDDEPSFVYDKSYPTFVKWASKVEKKVLELYKIMKKESVVKE